MQMPAADSPDKVSYIRTLPEAECFELLAVAIVGRVGFVSPAGLQIIPMNYRLGAGHQLFMKTAPDSALARLAEIDASVAFEVDYHADDFRIAWSVLMNGAISRLDAAATAAYEQLRRPPVPWTGSGSFPPVRFVPRQSPGVVCTALARTERSPQVGRAHIAGFVRTGHGGDIDSTDRLVRRRNSTRRVCRAARPRSSGRFDRGGTAAANAGR
jgi:nitroimidazol reductase NimA-like FMN-containing flavoprotein (pyridoxamine 5'-phosphate oxidase superfamily)